MKHIIVTGATGAIGSAISQELALKGYGLIMACRNLGKAQELAASLPKGTTATFLHLDLADSAQVHKAASELPRLIRPADTVAGLINNAGIMAKSFTLSPQQREMDMDVNYLNTRLWTRLLLQSGLITSPSSIVFTTSLTRFLIQSNTIPPQPTPKQFSQLGTYAASKRAITLYASALSVRLAPKGIYVNCADPGIVDSGMITMDRWFDPLTDIMFRPFIRKPKAGAIPALRALEAGMQGHYGRIYCRRTSHPFPKNVQVDLE